MGGEYRLSTLWQLDAPLDAVWQAIVDAEAWPLWWPGVETVVTLERGQGPGGLGSRQRFTWRGALPYRLSFVACLTRVEPLRLLEGRVAGELEGVGCWRFGCSTPRRSPVQSWVRFDWRVRTTPLWMNLIAPLAGPVFRWNHEVLMRAGGSGLARHLNARLGFQATWSV